MGHDRRDRRRPRDSTRLPRGASSSPSFHDEGRGGTGYGLYLAAQILKEQSGSDHGLVTIQTGVPRRSRSGFGGGRSAGCPGRRHLRARRKRVSAPPTGPSPGRSSRARPGRWTGAGPGLRVLAGDRRGGIGPAPAIREGAPGLRRVRRRGVHLLRLGLDRARPMAQPGSRSWRPSTSRSVRKAGMTGSSGEFPTALGPLAAEVAAIYRAAAAGRCRGCHSLIDPRGDPQAPAPGTLMTRSGLFDSPPIGRAGPQNLQLSGDYSTTDMVNRLEPIGWRWIESSPAEQDFLGWTLTELAGQVVPGHRAPGGPRPRPRGRHSSCGPRSGARALGL